MTDSRNERKHFLLRLQPGLYAAVEEWAAQEMRSVNGQIEWILRDAVRRRGGGPDRHDQAGGAGRRRS
jgi:hypothetical protein